MKNKQPPADDDQSSFVSLLDSFHPENGSSFLDPRIRNEQHESAWGAVWAEATLIQDTRNNNHNDDHANHDANLQNSPHAVPVQVATPVNAVEMDEDLTLGGATSTNTYNHDVGVSSPAVAATTANDYHETPCSQGHFMDIVVGSAMTIAAVSTTVGLDVGATAVYLVAVLFHKMAKACYKIHGPALLFFLIFMLISTLLLFVDTILLTVNIGVTELLAGLAYGLTCLFGGFEIGAKWHQFVRRLCHLVRWAVRDTLPSSVEPHRGIHVVSDLCNRNHEQQQEGHDEMDHVVSVDEVDDSVLADGANKKSSDTGHKD